MPTPENVYTAVDGAAFVQFAEGTEVHGIGDCFTSDALSDPQPGKTSIPCFDSNRNYVRVGETVTPASDPAFTVTGLSENAANYMERIKEAACRFTMFFTQAKCGDKAVFGNRERAYVYRKASITDDVVSNVMHRDTDAATERAFSVTAWAGRIDHRELTCARIATVETAALNDITACLDRCAGDCGPRIEVCQDLFVSADTVAAGVPDVLLSQDRGATWTSPASGFAATTSVMSGACFAVDKNTTRAAFVRDTLAATALQCEYTDDWGASWTQTDLGATPAEATTGGGSMFALDHEHIWVCTSGGRVYFSDDGAATWTDQTTALAASGANALNAVHFANANVGMAVGASDTVIVTVDGGVNWAAGTATGSGDGLLSVHVFDRQRAIVGTDGTNAGAGPLYMTYDWTANWTEITEGLNPAVTDTLEDVTFLTDDLTGFLVKNTSGPVGTVYKSIDGGWSWQAIDTPVNAGLNSVYVCQPNLAFTVGEQHAATSYIAQISG